MEKIITAAIILDIRFERKEDQKHPVKLRITNNRIQKYYSLSKWYTPEEFLKVRSKKPGKLLKEDKEWLTAKEFEATKVIKDLPYFTFEEFEANMFTNEGSKDVFIFMTARADELKKDGRIKTSISFSSAISSLKKVTGKEKLRFNEITVQFLSDYEKKMIEAGNSSTTVGIYLRNLRAIYNAAISKKYISSNYYPFGKGRYVIPTGKNLKKALTKKEVGLIFNYKIKQNMIYEQARDFWIFSYLCNGMNFKDIASLKYENIGTETLTFIRSKTARANKASSKLVVVPLTQEIRTIIRRWGNKTTNPKEYLFPVLKQGLTETQKLIKIASFVDLVNRNIEKVALLAGVNTKITTYTARHSFATILKRSGVSIEFISESLGHSNLATTENYLASFETEELFKNAAKLTDFGS